MERKTYLKSAAVLTLGGLISKVIGAVYRIPLTSFLGGYGMGLYQMAYPLFCVLLTFSSAGIPSAFSRIIASERTRGAEDGKTVKTALRLFAILGLTGTLAMFALANFMSELQGDEGLVRCYFMLAPAVFLVALIAVLRGYFQGKNDMMPTALSEIVEQIVKAVAGLFFAYRYRATPEIAAACTLLSVTISELFALGFLLLRYRGEYHVRSLRRKLPTGGEILTAVLPVMVATALLPLSQTVDSVVIVRQLATHSDSAVSLYGLFAGGALALMSLPATASYGLAAAIIPAVSSAYARGENEEGRLRAMYALALTLILAIPCAIVLYFFANHIVALLYPSLSKGEAALLVRLVKCTAISAVFLAGTDTLAACLTGMGRAKRAAAAMLIAVLVKFFLQLLLVSDLRFGILGAAVAANSCYLIAFFLDLVYTVRKATRKKIHDHDSRTRRKERGAYARGLEGAAGCGRSARPYERTSFRGKS